MKRTTRGRRRRPFLILAAIAAVTAPLIGCSAPAPASTLGTGAAVGPVPNGDLQKFYAQKLEWGPCAGFAPSIDDKATFAESKYDCTYLQVPLDYAQPNGKTAQIAVLRQKASAPNQKIGSLLVNPGGPGASGTESVTSVSKVAGDGPLAQRFDLVGFDPRGVGASKPAIHCFTPAERDADRADDEADNTPEGVAKLEQKAKDYDAKCEQRSGRDLLANVGTRDVVRDMDVLRSALGDAKLTYLGYSYGTRLGYSYAEAYPQNVRAMVLDGALDPDQNLIDRSVAQSAGFQQAFDAFAKSCASQPACPLGQDPAAATENFKKLVLPLIKNPFPQPDGRKLSYSDAMTGIIQALYSQQLWQPLQLGLQELADRRLLTDRPTGLIMLLADLYQGRQADGSYQYTLDAFTAIGCVDDKPVTDPAVTLEADKRARAAAPFRDDGRGPQPARDPCAFWPVPNTSEPHLPTAKGLPPVVVVSGTGDPATPYQAGVNLAKALSARLLTVEGNQHTVALQGASPCVDDAVTKYFTDLTLPPDTARCAVSAG
ncbi:alpha/beta hydrolase [Pseudonocardia acaciae]|uniref:alpha/beta hydrolase n=1 Tax=Pseudonocardia acaciae TaxID=551276 RepID=UPI000686D06D|nr:alpha/beta hydrolase [Pseudonocardia acaciae]